MRNATLARLRWAGLYRESDLYKAAIRLYTRPLFSWRKALVASSDGRTLYDFARQGLRNLDALHRSLAARRFAFRPGIALRREFHGKRRTLHIFPWEERVVDLLLFRLLNRRLSGWFSPNSYAYRDRGYGVDLCQRRIARLLTRSSRPLYALKRDVADYFPSIDHEILLAQLRELVDPDDFLFELLEQRVRFTWQEGGGPHTASRGVPFGAAIACLFANVYLTPLDRTMERTGVHWFRYADDLLALSPDRDWTLTASGALDEALARLRLLPKPSHALDQVVGRERVEDPIFPWAPRLRHLGLELGADGTTRLPREKFRKLCNLFRYAFRRRRGCIRRLRDPAARAARAIAVASGVIDEGVRNVAIIDYYLKHVNDEEQLRRLDRWLAEEVLAVTFGGHRRGHFRRLPFGTLREMGLPSLVHRRRLLLHRAIDSSFFIWQHAQQEKMDRGTAARPRRGARASGAGAFSPRPAAAAVRSS